MTWRSFPVIILQWVQSLLCLFQPTKNIARLVEICVGVICACMPSFSCMLRHHVSLFQNVRSRLTSRYQSFRGLLPGHSGSESAPSRSKFAKSESYPRSDSSLYSSGRSKKRSMSLPILHSHLGHLDTLRTYVRGGHRRMSETLEDGIRVTRDIEQNWERKSTVIEGKA